MEIKKPIPSFGNFIGQWHRSFCWIPRQTYDGRWVWLRNVWRRRVQLKEYLASINPYQDTHFWWFYSVEEYDD